MDGLYPLPDEDAEKRPHEMALHVLAYNIKRVMAVIDADPLIAAIKAA